MAFPAACSRRILNTVSNTNIPISPPDTCQANSLDHRDEGSFFDADHPATGVLFPRRSTQALEIERETIIDGLDEVLVDGSEEALAAEERLAAVEQELDTIEDSRISVDESLKPQLGTFLFIGADGIPRQHGRLFSQQPIRDPEADKAPADDGAGAGDDDGTVPAIRLSATLVDELATQRRQILAAHVASDSHLAVDLAIFLIANRAVYAAYHVRDHATLKAPAAGFPIMGFRDEESAASTALAEARGQLDTSWAGLATLCERFDAFRQLDDAARAAWLAFAVARSLEPTLNVADGGRSNGFHDHIGRLLGIDVAAWWRPTAANYFGRVKKDVMLDALQEIGGSTLRNRYKDAKKAELATYCGSLCAGQGIVEADVRDKALAWLPDVMRFDLVEQAERVRPHSEFLADDGEEDGDEGVGDDIDAVSDSVADDHPIDRAA